MKVFPSYLVTMDYVGILETKEMEMVHLKRGQKKPILRVTIIAKLVALLISN